MKVIQDFVKQNYSTGRKGKYPIDTVVIHVTEGSAESTRAWFHDPASQVSAHYLVTKKGVVWQFVREDDTAWGNGRVDNPTAQAVVDRIESNPNWWTISIEHEGSGNEDLTDAQRTASLQLIRDIRTRHFRVLFDRRHILRHNEIFAPKECPGAIDVDRLVRELNLFADVSSGSSSTAPTI